MKIYKNLCEAIVEALQQIFKEGQKADRVVDHYLQSNRKWGSRDRRFIARYIYETVRWYRLAYEVGLDGKEPQTDEDWWKVLATVLLLDGLDLPEWQEWGQISKATILEKNSLLHKNRVVYTSIPDWLDAFGVSELGETVWTKTIEALNQPAKLVLRVNTLKTNRAKVLEQLKREGIEAKAIGEGDAIVLEEAKNLNQLQLYQDGCFEVQDYSSQQVVPFLNPSKGAVVIDACAGAGGKSLHLAAWLKNRGFIRAMDVEEFKLKELERRAKRASAQIITTQKVAKNAQLPQALMGSCDYLLLDAPCSGSGVLRRNPDAKWKLSPAFLEEVKELQRYILKEYSKMLKSGGTMLYATCSIFPSENEQQMAWFLEDTEIGKEFTLLKDRKILPQDEGFDGFYMALLKRK